MPDIQITAVDASGPVGRRRLAFFWPGTTAVDRSLLKRRGVALFLTLLVHVLLLLLLLLQRGYIQPRKEEDRLTVFSLMPDPSKSDEGNKSKTKPRHAERQAAAKAPVPAKPVPPQQPAPAFIQMTSRDFSAANIAALPSQGTKADTGGSSGNSSAVAGPGEGPGGVRLYEAEWYRRPTNGELAGYMPANPPRSGWGLVACKTVEHYHVENCQPLGESPIGSGLARAVREAAWQFLVLPPRIDGKPLVGAWVRIRIDYSQRPAEEAPGG